MIDYVDDDGNKTYRHIKAENIDEAKQMLLNRGVEIIDIYEITDPTF